MRLIGSDGHGVELGVGGYQFPDAVDPRQRQSWLIVEGSAHCPQGAWSFRWQALTADDAVELARWLGRAAARPFGSEHDDSGRLDFTEANLAFAFTWTDPGLVELRVSLDLEFSPPWRRQARSGEPFVVTSRLTAEEVLTAATEWAAEITPYPPAGDANLR
ncbi:WapI family immunity protein [Streptomyces amritsarensis]|uniref:WapI family immunity protein n=1 Tax=Streptomyces amritsarensis TaxID=681158 RepID=UPI0036842DB8